MGGLPDVGESISQLEGWLLAFKHISQVGARSCKSLFLISGRKQVDAAVRYGTSPTFLNQDKEAILFAIYGASSIPLGIGDGTL